MEQTLAAVRTDLAFDIELQTVLKTFGDEAAVQDLTLQIRPGEFFSILGPSGCGKTTTLRLIAGFETPTAGSVCIQGQDMTQVPPYQRPVNTVFQSYALFRHLNVWENVAFGLKLQKLPREEVRSRVATALEQVKLDGFAKRTPAQLSGGQQQRVALARALVNRPAVLLLDEPLGALDLKLRKEMQLELAHLHRSLGLTFVMVTHDQEEALSLSDRIAVMNQGRLEQMGTPSQIYEEPETAFVADFIGDTNLLRGRVSHSNGSTVQLVTEAGLPVWTDRRSEWNGTLPQKLVVSIRPEKIRVSQLEAAGHDAHNCYAGRLRQVMYLGPNIQFQIELATGEHLTVLQPNRARLPALDTEVQVSWSAGDGRALVA
ncbi:MAG: ABC transporter ATP-binding protein [Synechococcales cyanobacterium RU_4_20]|nr:ABC transporter ATP-binding protein [Synechococcales cyanobacterium RU_4_20]NJR68645.1 ABC transporter ATP-binding protein [Synechococcales cyanobacterium CRU_2_2]